MIRDRFLAAHLFLIKWTLFVSVMMGCTKPPVPVATTADAMGIMECDPFVVVHTMDVCPNRFIGHQVPCAICSRVSACIADKAVYCLRGATCEGDPDCKLEK